jgi:hypothetical protein
LFYTFFNIKSIKGIQGKKITELKNCVKQKDSSFRLAVIMNGPIAGYQMPHRSYLCGSGQDKSKMTPKRKLEVEVPKHSLHSQR